MSFDHAKKCFIYAMYDDLHLQKYGEEISSYLSFNYGIITLDMQNLIKNIRYDKCEEICYNVYNFVITYFKNQKVFLKNINDVSILNFFENHFEESFKLIRLNLDCNSLLKIFQQIDKQVLSYKLANMNLATLSKFNHLPETYKAGIECVYNKLCLKMSDDILFFMIVGSCSKNSVIENWSDIDVIVVLDDTSHEKKALLKNIFLSSSIKIGYTVYDKKQFENSSVDFKTAFAIYQMQNGEYYQPLMLEPKLKIPFFSKIKLKIMGKNQLPSMIHQINRIIYDKDIKSADKLFKEIIHVMRIILFLEDYNPVDYKDVAKTYSKLFSIEILDVEEYIKTKDFSRICNYAIRFLENLLEEVKCDTKRQIKKNHIDYWS